MPTFQQFPLPDAGEGLTEAEIVAWHVAVGDTVEVNQTIVEIETAKSLVDLPSPWAGVVTRLMVEPGQTVDVGTPIIEVDTDPDGAAPADEEPPAVTAAAAQPSGGAVEHGHRGGGDRHAGVEPGGSDEIAAARADRAVAPQPNLLRGRRCSSATGSPSPPPAAAAGPRTAHRPP